MSLAPPPPPPPTAPPPVGPPGAHAPGSPAATAGTPAAPAPPLLRAPLAPVALAVTAGLVADRYLSLPPMGSALATAAALGGWFAARTSPRPLLPVLYLGLAFAALAAFYHHASRDVYPADDIGEFATAEPQRFRLRGRLADEPVSRGRPAGDVLLSQPGPEVQ